MPALPWEPILALMAGIMIFAMPRLLNYVVATYLVIIGVVGLVQGMTSPPVQATGMETHITEVSARRVPDTVLVDFSPIWSL